MQRRIKADNEIRRQGRKEMRHKLRTGRIRKKGKIITMTIRKDFFLLSFVEVSTDF